MNATLRSVKAGHDMADAILEFCHTMYNQATARRVIAALGERIQNRLHEFDDTRPANAPCKASEEKT